MPPRAQPNEDRDGHDDPTRDPPAQGLPPEPPDDGETVSLGSYASGGTRYRIMRPIGKGGIGEVWLARDLELNRDVALKQLQARHQEHPDFRRRFLREVRATAALEHPGIIPVYDIGQHPDGRLFQVMRYFGEGNLHTLIRDYHRDHPREIDDVAFRSLLGHFVAACRAIAYAHAREVIHLDLKPANVVTGPFGETQVIDWGMAWIRGQALWEQVAEESGSLSGGSASDSGSVPDMTKPGGFRGTEVYASPEQHRRRWDAIGTRTDVYGLGAMLFVLLSDEAPFKKGSDTFHADVIAGHRHSEPKPWAPPALVAIAAKAMAPDPKARYESAAALAEEVDRYLADESVSAFPDPPSIRVWRFVKRHRALVAAAAALLMTSAVALGIGYVAVAEQRDRAVKAEAEAVVQRDRAREAEAMAVKERDRARDAEAEARRQERLARQNAAATRGVIAGFIESVADDQWAKVPGTAELRLNAVRKVLDEYPALIEQQPDDPDLRYDAALLDRRCANLYRTLGRLDEAKPLYERARDEIRSLLDAHPENDRYRLGWILLLLDEGERALRTVGPDGALVIYREAFADATKAVEVRPGSFFARRTLAQARMDLADVLHQAGDVREAAELSRRSAEEFGRFTAADCGDNEVVWQQTRFLASLAATVAARGALEARENEMALAMARVADRRSEELAGEDPMEPNVSWLRGVALGELGHALAVDASTRAAAEATLEEAIEVCRHAVTGDDAVANFRPALADLLCDRAESLLDAGHHSCAAEVADEAIGVMEPLDAPGDAFEANRHLARARALRGRAAKSREDLLLARECYAAVLPAAPRNEKLREEAAVVERLLGE